MSIAALYGCLKNGGVDRGSRYAIARSIYIVSAGLRKKAIASLAGVRVVLLTVFNPRPCQLGVSIEASMLKALVSSMSFKRSKARIGFEMYPSIPAARHRSLSPAMACAVIAMIGMR
jgi:hypothetical protein